MDARAQVAVAERGYPASWDEAEQPSPRAEWWRRYKLHVYTRACELRDRMRTALGGKCAECGTDEKLAFHHPKGRSWEPREHNLLQRMRLYWRDFDAGRLTLLCEVCNGRDGAANAKFYRRRRRR